MSVAGFKKGIKSVEMLQKTMGISDYNEFYRKINKLVEEGKLVPTMGGKDTNGKTPPLAKKYRIIEGRDFIASDYRVEMDQYFPLCYKRAYYKAHLNQYHNDREIIMKISSYANLPHKPLSGIMSVNERLFDMFNHEKEITLQSLERILKNLGLDVSYLNIYLTPEPFIYYSRGQEGGHKILIVENKDTWYTMRRLMEEGSCEFDTLIYGEGKKILSSIEETQIHQKSYFTNPNSSYKYFGDLDDEGISIYLSLMEKAPYLDLSLWEKGYRKMLERAEEENKWRFFKAQKKLSEEVLLKALSFFEKSRIQHIARQFEKNVYVPQEIVNYQILKEMWSSRCTHF